MTDDEFDRGFYSVSRENRRNRSEYTANLYMAKRHIPAESRRPKTTWERFGRPFFSACLTLAGYGLMIVFVGACVAFIVTGGVI